MAGDTRLQWLMEQGGPAIRYRTATELLPEAGRPAAGALAGELAASPLAQAWMARLGSGTGLAELHHSRDEAFENAAGKLTQLGLKRDVPAFAARLEPFRAWLEAEVAGPPHDFHLFYRSLVAAQLARSGYVDEPAVRSHILGHLADLAGFARQGRYDLYVDQDTYPGYPKAFRRYPLLDPAICGHDRTLVPVIHDLYALACLPRPWPADVRPQIDAALGYILNPDYERLSFGYGVVKGQGRKFYGMGWDCRLPGYAGFRQDDPALGALVQYVEMMAHFPAAVAHPWFGSALEHLRSFRTPRGTVLFPRAYLHEGTGYWVGGSHMGLEEVRRTSQALELESTFWMLRIERTVAETRAIYGETA